MGKRTQTLDRGNLPRVVTYCANIIAKGFSNDQLTFYANTTCHWNTGVMVADNRPLYAYVDTPFKISRF